jgi:NO-binding membrane sensor protein with MHYT domain
MPAAELWLLLASCVACVTAAWAAARLVRRRSVQVDRWMPHARLLGADFQVG